MEERRRRNQWLPNIAVARWLAIVFVLLPYAAVVSGLMVFLLTWSSPWKYYLIPSVLLLGATGAYMSLCDHLRETKPSPEVGDDDDGTSMGGADT